MSLIDNKLGVFEDPFEHQVFALEQYLSGKDLFVSTGTGSGKTECFIWPILSKLIDEAIDRPESFKKPGVRTLIIYPMNALVNDQMRRFREILKGQQITFPIHLFNARRLQTNVIREYDGTNIRELAKKYGYSEKTVRRMIKDSLEE